jgi:NTP pyrophosphatase (non-canonical NTP hydrolase)
MFSVTTPRDIDELIDRLRAFGDARDWGRFHTPKNLVMALSGEVGELITLFQWLTPAESAAIMSDEQTAPNVRDEIADVFIYLVRLADVLGIDLLNAAHQKMLRNETRFPPANV